MKFILNQYKYIHGPLIIIKGSCKSGPTSETICTQGTY